VLTNIAVDAHLRDGIRWTQLKSSARFCPSQDPIRHVRPIPQADPRFGSGLFAIAVYG